MTADPTHFVLLHAGVVLMRLFWVFAPTKREFSECLELDTLVHLRAKFFVISSHKLSLLCSMVECSFEEVLERPSLELEVSQLFFEAYAQA